MMKITVRKKTWIFVLPLLAIAAGCAKSAEQDDDRIEKELLDAYITTHPDEGYVPTGTGLYIKTERTGTGVDPGGQDFVYVNYTYYDLKGNVLMSSNTPSSNSDSIARQLGTLAYTTYYGPKLWRLGNSAIYAGVEEALKTMKEGGKVRVLMPSWLSTTGSSDRALSATVAIEIELLEVIADIEQFQTDTLQAFSNRYYDGLYPAKDDWYFKTLVRGGQSGIPTQGDTLDIRYAGYLLDGFVFDTNIADSAVYYNIYDKTKTYNTFTFVYDTLSTKIVTGFRMALGNMEQGDEAVSFFSSDYGYKADGSGQIQPYSPLRFYLKLEKLRAKSKE